MRTAMKFGLGLGALGAAATVAAGAPELAMLSTLERGKWTINRRDGTPPRAICVGNPAWFLQLGHARKRGCNRVILDDKPSQVTVQYTCRGSGYGRTSIRRETATLVQIDSQGVADGRPFQFSAEARRSGVCR